MVTGFYPVGAVFFTDSIAAHSTVDSTNVDVMALTFGAMDGTNEGLSGVVEDDGNATSSTGSIHSDTKSMANYLADAAGGAPIIQSEADGLLAASTLQLSWNDIDSVARAYSWIALGSAATSAAIYEPLPFFTPIGKAL
jgi:hypothetical protein